MPFRTTDPVMERARLVAAHLDGLYSVTELADRFGVSRPTVYKWIDRYRTDGVEPMSLRWLSRTLCDHAVHRTRLRSSSKPARPYIWRLSIFSRLICPSA